MVLLLSHKKKKKKKKKIRFVRCGCRVIRPYTAAGYAYVEESGDKAGKSACLNTTDMRK